MSSSVWPYDTLRDLPPLKGEESITAITCFIASPFNPPERWNDLFAMIERLTEQLGHELRIPVRCRRADTVATAGIIQAEIWQAIRDVDIVICDVTGHNGNVLLELGVAATIRRKESVIILREQEDDRPHLFHISPARHIEYTRSFAGYQKLLGDLGEALAGCLATIPFQPSSGREVALPFAVRFEGGRDSLELYTQDITHRRILPDCLEFGAPVSYRRSWMSLGNLSVANVQVRAEMQMRPPTGMPDHFMGIMLRGQSYLANYGYLTIVRANGNVSLSYPQNESLLPREDTVGNLGAVPLGQFARFEVAIDEQALSLKVEAGGRRVETRRAIADLPYVFTSGRVVFVAGFCRVGLKEVSATAP